MPPPLEESSIVAHAEPQGYHERLQALEKREQMVEEKERFVRDSHCRVYMGREKISVFNLNAETPCGPLEGPVAVASKEELERTMMRICEVSEVERTLATHMLPVACCRRHTPGRRPRRPARNAKPALRSWRSTSAATARSVSIRL